MRGKELHAFRQSSYLREIYDDRVIGLVRPAFERLLDALAALPEDASSESKLRCFESCVLALNELAHDIDTIAREVMCDRLYDLGELVGLDASTLFVDKWRDW